MRIVSIIKLRILDSKFLFGLIFPFYKLRRIKKNDWQNRISNEENNFYNKLLNLITLSKRLPNFSSRDYPAGYQDLTVVDKRLIGKRDVNKRLSVFDYDFTGKNVLDLGCNNGAVLLELSKTINCGTGLDLDFNSINIANRIKNYLGFNNITFYTFDLAKNEPEYILDLIDEKLDLIICFSILAHLKNWRQIVKFISLHSDNVLVEITGSERHKNEEYLEFLKYYDVIEEKYSSLDDSMGRKLFHFSR